MAVAVSRTAAAAPSRVLYDGLMAQRGPPSLPSSTNTSGGSTLYKVYHTNGGVLKRANQKHFGCAFLVSIGICGFKRVLQADCQGDSGS